MPIKLSPHFIELVYDAALKSFWRKQALRNFLRRSHIHENFLAQLSMEERKRDWLDQLFPRLEATDRGQALLQEMARSLADQTTFPDLEGIEDSAEKIRAAKAAVHALQQYLLRKDEESRSAKEQEQLRKQAAAARARTLRSAQELQQLQERLNALCSQLGTQAGGYAFQAWFYDLMDFSEVENRRPYVAAERQIDGSITIDGTTYLVELKFTSCQASATDVDSLLAKVNTKADNTMGIMVSMSGYSSTATRGASVAKTPLLLLDHSHLYLILSGGECFPEVVRRVRRHSSQTGEAFLAVAEFGGTRR